MDEVEDINNDMGSQKLFLYGVAHISLHKSGLTLDKQKTVVFSIHSEGATAAINLCVTIRHQQHLLSNTRTMLLPSLTMLFSKQIHYEVTRL